ncbi:hypothetical protein KR222_008659, partial [Zaprionus bogoriensis]
RLTRRVRERKPLPTMVYDEKYFNKTLEKLLAPRWVGSSGHAKVSNFLYKELARLGFLTFRDIFFDGVNFTNILAVQNIQAPGLLMLSCHYDSKFLNGSTKYVGATDGAVSCAILLNVAHTLRHYIKEKLKLRHDIGLLLVFFDGHESFADVLDDSNSLNGSRRFAEVELIQLQSIEVVVTLNLIGAPNHIYMSHYESTFPLHNKLVDIEAQLRKSGKLSACHQLFHKLRDHDSDFEDDHYPLITEGVAALHVVPHTYPDVWHTEADNLSNLHWPTVRNMNLIITQFVYDY